MQLSPYVEELRTALLTASESGGEQSQDVAQRLLAPLDSTARLVLLAAVSAAADEITLELAPVAVEVRLRGVDPEFVVTSPPDAASETEPQPIEQPTATSTLDSEEGGTVRTTLRLPDQLKLRVEDAAARAGLSVNAWLVRAITDALDTTPPRQVRPAPSEARRLTGWAH